MTVGDVIKRPGTAAWLALIFTVLVNIGLVVWHSAETNQAFKQAERTLTAVQAALQSEIQARRTADSTMDHRLIKIERLPALIQGLRDP